jgi:hypothetical protein
MKLKIETIELWKIKLNESLPGLIDAINNQSSKTFLIGASLFDIYKTEGWIDIFSRKTGDADFTIEYLGDPQNYQKVCVQLLSLGYQKDPIHPYRYHPPVKRGIYAYVDLLTFTTDLKLESSAKRAMNVGESFNFEGMDFAKHSPLHFDGNIYFPNPLALIYLKMRSYYHNPERLKDFVDFIEIILRVATEDKILRDLKKIATTNTLAQVKDNFLKVCAHIEEDRGGTWDLEDIKREMDSRGLLSEFEWDEIPQTVEFFRTKVF